MHSSVATFKTSYLSILVMSPSLLVFRGLQHVAATSQGFAETVWGFEVVCQEGMCSAKDLIMFYIRCSQTCITILFGAKQSFALVVFVIWSKFLALLVDF